MAAFKLIKKLHTFMFPTPAVYFQLAQNFPNISRASELPTSNQPTAKSNYNILNLIAFSFFVSALRFLLAQNKHK